MGDSESIYEPGDIVQHRNGGPLMVVRGRTGDLLDCIWFDVDGKRRCARIPAHELKPGEAA